MRVFKYLNIIGGFILLHFNCDSEVPAEGTGYTSNLITECVSVCVSVRV